MLTYYQVQTIVSQCIRRMTGGNQTYSRTKTFAQMGIMSDVRFNGFVDRVYYDRTVGLPYYHHGLPINAFDGLGPSSKIGEAEDIVITASPLAGRVINPV